MNSTMLKASTQVRFPVMRSPLSQRHEVGESPERVYLIKLVMILALCFLPRDGCTQVAGLASVSVNDLPAAPDRSRVETKEKGARGAEDTASISGKLLDANGGALVNARVTLTLLDGSGERTLSSDEKGDFSFQGLPAGNFTLTITAPGMEPFALQSIALLANEARELRQIPMSIAGTTTEVQVVVTKTELAQEQMKSAEHQRVFGILPNFYSSYIWDAEPLDSKQKFNLALHSIADPIEFVGTGIIAAAEQANDTFSGYGQGAKGYAKRYGAAYADDVTGRMIGSVILPSLLHQDPRYFYKGSGSVRSRMCYAVTRAVVTRGDNGQTQHNYSRLLGSFAAGGLANLYYPRSDRGLGLTLGGGFVSIAGHAVDNLIREFFLRTLTPNVPDYERGKQ